MTIAERYSTARQTSNLRSTLRTTQSASDVLAAAGMAAQEHETALLLWSVTFNGKTSEKITLVGQLARRLAHEMDVQRWKGHPELIAMEVLAWWLHGVCQPCGGRGYQLILGTPHLSDDLCTHCHGSGKIPLPPSDPHAWLIEKLGALQSIAGGQVMRKLHSSMEL